MNASNDSNIRILSPAQTQALTAAAVACEGDQDADRSVRLLVSRARAILGVDVVVFCRRAGVWSEVAAQPSSHPFARSVESSLDQAREALVAQRIGGEEWTLVLGGDEAPRAALAVQGDWTLSAKPLLLIAGLLRRKLDREGTRAAARAVARLNYRMMHALARARGVANVGDTVLRHAARAVDARVGAIAVTESGSDRASIVATFGYPLILVEHMQIEPGAGVIGAVLQSRRPMRESGIGSMPRVLRPRYRTNSFVAVPILSGRDTLGVLCVTDKRGDRPFSTLDVTTLRTFTAGAALAFERERALHAAQMYEHAAAVDPVTGLFNRRYFQVRLDEELQRSIRHEMPVGLLLIDLDDFKAVNDSYGHLAGDTVLWDIADILHRCVRIFDVCARFGGEEYVIVMPAATNGTAYRLAERVRQCVEAYRPASAALADLRITVSIGFAISSSNTTVHDLLDEADKALYSAKQQGKNRIGNPQPSPPSEG
ncbi:MAG: hypothetical protein JWL71_2692 [Acidobacteria bacterium]|nr:hypothetical protein [Acidobacteriota bacterium]